MSTGREDGNLVWGRFEGYPWWPAQIIPMSLGPITLGVGRVVLQKEAKKAEKKFVKEGKRQAYLVRFFGDGSYDFLCESNMKDFAINEDAQLRPTHQERTMESLRRYGEQTAENYAAGIDEIKYCAYRREKYYTDEQLRKIFPSIFEDSGRGRAERERHTIDFPFLDIREHMPLPTTSGAPGPASGVSDPRQEREANAKKRKKKPAEEAAKVAKPRLFISPDATAPPAAAAHQYSPKGRSTHPPLGGPSASTAIAKPAKPQEEDAQAKLKSKFKTKPVGSTLVGSLLRVADNYYDGPGLASASTAPAIARGPPEPAMAAPGGVGAPPAACAPAPAGLQAKNSLAAKQDVENFLRMAQTKHQQQRAIVEELVRKGLHKSEDKKFAKLIMDLVDQTQSIK